MKSGPTLNGCTLMPRSRKAAKRPNVTVVLPEPVIAAEMMHAFIVLELWLGVKPMSFKTIEWTNEGVRMIDQRKLPTVEEYPIFRTYQEIAEAIRSMVVRGAPAIGVAAAMGIALGIQKSRAR